MTSYLVPYPFYIICVLVSDYLLIVLPCGSCHYEAVSQKYLFCGWHCSILLCWWHLSVRIFNEIVIWGYSSVIWCCITGWSFPDAFELEVCEDEGTMVFQNVGNCLLSIMGSYDTRMEFSITPLKTSKLYALLSMWGHNIYEQIIETLSWLETPWNSMWVLFYQCHG